MMLLPVATFAALLGQVHKPMCESRSVSVLPHASGVQMLGGTVWPQRRVGGCCQILGTTAAACMAFSHRRQQSQRSKKFSRQTPSRLQATAGTEFAVADGREVKVLADREALVAEIASQTACAAKDALAQKGDFSLCIPGGFGPADGRTSDGAKLIGQALQSLADQKDLNFAHWHVFFAGARLDNEESYLLAKELWLDACGIPPEQVYPVPQDIPAEGAAATYTAKICMQDENVMQDSPDGLPALDLLLLNMDSDGSVGRLLPASPELDEAGTGKLILPVEDEDEAAIASVDFMNAACRAILVAGGQPNLSTTVVAALGAESPSCPASFIRPAKTLWLLDADSGSEVQS